MSMIKGLGHAAFRIRDLQSSLDFYCGTLGLEEAFRLDRDGEPSPWIVYLHVGPNQFLELFPNGEGEVKPRSRAAGYNHLCLVVDDLQAVAAELTAKGVRITSGPKQGTDHNWQAWIDDPDGNAIELMQIHPDSPQAATDKRSALA
jgi:lactoylglutathione lyase